MTVTMPKHSNPRPPAIQGGDDRIIELIAMVGTAFAPRAAEDDRDCGVVAENFRVLQSSDSARLTVQVGLDDLEATLRQVRHVQARLSRACTSTTPTAARRFITLITVYPQRRVADVGLILTSGGAAGSRRGGQPHNPW